MEIYQPLMVDLKITDYGISEIRENMPCRAESDQAYDKANEK